MADPRSEALASALQQLTHREREVLALLGKGLTVPEIAHQLHRSQKTVESHRLALGRKLGADNRVKLARLAIQAGLAPLPKGEPSAAPQRGGGETGRPWQAIKQVERNVREVAGQAYFYRLLPAVSAALGVCGAMIGQLLGPRWNARLSVLTDVDVAGSGRPTTYALNRTPCERAVAHGQCRYDHGVHRTYPNCRFLQEVGASAYLAVRLTGTQGQPLGVLGLMHDRPLDREIEPETLLEVLAGRASAELERARMREQLQQPATPGGGAPAQTAGGAVGQPAMTAGGSGATTPASTKSGTAQAPWQGLQELVDQAQSAVGALDQADTIVFANEGLCQLLGQERDQIVGRRVTDFVAAEHVSWFRWQLSARQHQPRSSVEVTLLRPDNWAVRVRIDVRSLFDQQQRYLGSISVLDELERWPRAGQV